MLSDLLPYLQEERRVTAARHLLLHRLDLEAVESLVQQRTVVEHFALAHLQLVPCGGDRSRDLHKVVFRAFAFESGGLHEVDIRCSRLLAETVVLTEVLLDRLADLQDLGQIYVVRRFGVRFIQIDRIRRVSGDRRLSFFLDLLLFMLL